VVGTAHGTLFLWRLGEHNGASAASLEMMAEHSDGVTSVSLSASGDESGSSQGLCAAADNEGIVRMYRPSLDTGGVWGLVAECDLGSRLSLHVLRNHHLILFGQVLREWPLDHLPTSSDHLPTSSAAGASASSEPSEFDASLDLPLLDTVPAAPLTRRAHAYDGLMNDLNAASAAPEPRCAAPPQPAPQPTKAVLSPTALPSKIDDFSNSKAFSEDAAFAEKMTHALEAVGRQVFGVEETDDEENTSNCAPNDNDRWYSEEPQPSTENAALFASAALQSTHRTAAAAVQRAEALQFDKGAVQVPEARRAALANAAVLTQRDGRYGNLAALEPEPKLRGWLPKKQVSVAIWSPLVLFD